MKLLAIALVHVVVSVPASAAPASPPDAFFQLEFCAGASGGSCSLGSFLKTAFPGWTLTWVKGPRPYNWTLHAEAREAKHSLELEIHRDCVRARPGEGGPQLWATLGERREDGRRTSKLPKVLRAAFKKFEHVKREVAPRPPEGKTPSREFLALELCGPDFGGTGRCTVEQFIHKGLRDEGEWRWLNEESHTTWSGEVKYSVPFTGWYYVVTEHSTREDVVDPDPLVVFLHEDCSQGLVVANFAEIYGLGSRDAFPLSPPATINMILDKIKEPRPWPPSD